MTQVVETPPPASSVSHLPPEEGGGAPHAENARVTTDRHQATHLWATGEPIRGEAFSHDHLELHARQMAAEWGSQLERAAGAHQCWRRFADNSAALRQAYAAFARAVRRGEPIAPSGEWLLDNFYIIEEQLRDIRVHVPRKYYRELPKLSKGPLAGYPQVYAASLELVAHTDSSLDEETLASFISTYQSVSALTMGELWAMPAMLRLVLIENLRRISDQELAVRREHAAAEEWLQRAMDVASTTPDSETRDDLRVASALVRLRPYLNRPMFLIRLADLLRQHGEEQGRWADALERWLAEHGRTLAEITRHEHQRLAANQVSIGNAVTSMRLLSALDWNVFFERVSLTERALRNDPAGVYASMDFATRDSYRHAVEEIAKSAPATEVDVARHANAMAASAHSHDPRQRHVGYWLLGPGRESVEREVRFRPSFYEGLCRTARLCASPLYFGAIATLTIAVVGLAMLLAARMAPDSTWLPALAGLAVLLPASEAAIALVNFLVMACIRPRLLPKLEFKHEVPLEHQTIVVVPTLLGSPAGVAGLLERLEVHYLANPEGGLYFALLTDFTDAKEEHVEADQRLLDQVRSGIERLNARYPLESPGAALDRFFVFHRARRWNPSEKCWMGWERKRGKLAEFNRLLRGATDTTFEFIEGRLHHPEQIRFVITLDSDTQLPPGAARRMAGALAHPLNRPRFDPQARRVVAGYGVLQPRVSVLLPSAGASRFARIFAGHAGLDPYTTAVSDVYQDVFREANFTGKGIYEVDAFEAATGKAFPENHILSHDLIEGCHARVGLASDIELFDGFPSRYHAFAKRAHRWVRGDWQISPWLFPVVPAAGGWRANPLTGLCHWKILDNLRRSLLPVALLTLLVLGWTVLPGAPWAWTLAALAVVAAPVLAQLSQVVRTIVSTRNLEAWAQPLADARTHLLQALLAVTWLAHQSTLMLDAIARTLYRMLFSHHSLLEWETASSAERRLECTPQAFWREMWPSAAIAVAVLPFLRWSALPVALPILALWIAAPWIAYYVSRPLEEAETPLDAAERQRLRQIARRTWTYFENFLSAEDNWLPPDNYQEYPVPAGNLEPGMTPGVAHRTSPTNEGLFLVSSLAAHDLGYISLHEFTALLEKNLDSWERLERYHGHFLNWYDTTRLTSLRPRYVSTVDSGNLAASLLTVREGLQELISQPLRSDRWTLGLHDTLAHVHDALERVHPPGMRFVNAALTKLQNSVMACQKHVPAEGAHVDEWQKALALLAQEVDPMLADVRAFLEEIRPSNKELKFAVERLVCHIRGLARDAELLTPARSAPPTTSGASIPATAPSTNGDIDHWNWGSTHGAHPLAQRLRVLSERLQKMASEMDFSLTYDRRRRLFAIGFNLDDERLDNSYYDLLASEARLASFLAIGKGDVDVAHWFRLGRALTRAGERNVLLSWSGTMFEYLMPLLFQRNFAGTLLDESCRGAVDRQIEYGKQKGVPWGISESAFSAINISQDYHYQAFGAPGLGLKRGLGQDLVIAPYATALALSVRPHEALANLDALAKEGGEGVWGFYEAMDYTTARLPVGARVVPVRCFMSHHQGMLLTAIANCLNDAMLQRFARMPLVRAAELLLHERPPNAPELARRPEVDVETVEIIHEFERPVSRRLSSPDSAAPRTHLLANRNYSVLLTNAGTGYSRRQNVQLTRWRPDATLDPWGQFILLRDLNDGATWSATAQPLGRRPEDYEVIFSVDKARFRRRDGEIETRLEVVVSPEHDVESRLVTLINHGRTAREIEITSFAELALAAPATDLSHQAFHKLFVQTESPDPQTLLAMRRPRTPEQDPLWAFHVLALEGMSVGDLEHETDRARFLGRRRTIHDPAALDPGARLSSTTGAVLDPIFSLRCRIRLAPGQMRMLAFSTGSAGGRPEVAALADQYHELRAVKRSFELAWAHSQVELRHQRLSPADVHLFQRLAAGLLFVDQRRRAPSSVLAENKRGQTGLWQFGVSGDNPILLLKIADSDHMAIFRDLLRAHAYWRSRGLYVDLVILNEHAASYLNALHEQLAAIVRNSEQAALLDRPGGVYLLRGAHLHEVDHCLLQTAAQVVLDARNGSLGQQVEPMAATPILPDLLETRALPAPEQAPPAPPEIELRCDNGLGGFDRATGDYIIRLAEGRAPKMPWANVIANPRFGCLVTEAGGGYTWCENSRENKLTPWFNDPVSDPPGEALYLRDEATGEIWSPLPAWQRRRAWTVRHRPGASSFTSHAHGLAQECLISIAPEDPVKFVRLTLENQSGRDRELSATYFAEWVLGVQRELTQLYVTTERDADTDAMFARNVASQDFAQQVAFLQAFSLPGGERPTITGDRTEFLGRLGRREDPAALERAALSGRCGAGLDPCGAMQVKFKIPAGESIVVYVLLGQGASTAEARELVARYSAAAAVDEAVAKTTAQWDELLSAVQVKTPNPGLDVLVNRWLVYQTASCRLWGRSGLYQSGGAYGFRDQLQDVMALVYARPELARAHILRAASRQFMEGDVQHWWHPPQGRGVRTHFSDDFLWLAYVTLHYLDTTGDKAILDEQIPFVRSAPLGHEEEERYETPEVTAETDSLFGHCQRAIDHGLRLGPHGLPRIGTGDWNDGYNLIGVLGQGETVWGGWFLLEILERFAPVVAGRGDQPRANELREQATKLRAAIETHAWDGGWYLRAFFDDGTPLGSAQNQECQIDSLSQTWAVFAGGDPHRARTAMRAVAERLVRPDVGLIQLFTPPFDQSPLEPGYVKGYLPGVRENGGQYTHAALWVVRAFAQLGAGGQAMALWELLNPVRHSLRHADTDTYQVEPYVVAADVYSRPPHVGRGGWTWYTGSASWMYRVALESLLGFQLRGDRLRIDPCIPAEWDRFEFTYRRGTTTYEIVVENCDHVERGVREMSCDGTQLADLEIPLVDDGQKHHVRVQMGS